MKNRSCNSKSLMTLSKLNKTQGIYFLKLKNAKVLTESIYPDWLRSRSDFQKAMIDFEEIDQKDISIIFRKSQEDLSPYEKQATYNWVQSITFFSSMSLLKIKDLTQLFAIETIKCNTVLVRSQLDYFLYILVRGVILIQSSYNKTILKSKDVLTQDALLNTFGFPEKLTAQTDCMIIKLTKSQYEDALLSQKIGEKYEVSNFLKKIAYFNGWSIGRLASLTSKIFVQNIAKGEILYTFDEPSDSIFIVKSGLILEQINLSINYTNSWPVRLDQKEKLFVTKNYLVEFSQYDCGKMFGINENHLSGKRETQAKALKNSVLYKLQTDTFYEILSDIEKNQLRMMGVYSSQRAEVIRQKKMQVKKTIVQSKLILSALEVNIIPPSNIFKNREIDRKMQCAKKIVYHKINNTNKELKDVRSYTKLYDKNNQLIRRCCSRDESYMYKTGSAFLM